MDRHFQRIDLGITKCYLLECPGGYLLVDTAYPDDYQKFLQTINALGVDLSQINYLLLTHHHDDHAGFAARLVEQTGCKVIVHQSAVSLLSKGEPEEAMSPVNRCIQVVFSLFTLIHRDFRYPPLTIEEDDLILPGDDFDLLKGIGIDGEILHTPGHSKDSISVVLSDGNAFVGDVAMNFLNFCGIHYRPIFIEDLDQVFASWDKLIAHGAKHIHPAHGAPFSAMELRRSRERYLEKNQK
jgi:glyoxylase-like metal-dependent hydrolase (beta-lactamase superfamily II)